MSGPSWKEAGRLSEARSGRVRPGVREPEPGRRGVEKLLRPGARVIRNGYSTVSFRLCNLHFNDNRINPSLKKLL